MSEFKVHHNVVIACDQWGTIGNKGALPWGSLAGDLKRFRDLTMGHVVVMGRKTWESLPMYPKGLPGRLNVVVTNNANSIRFGCELPHCEPLDESIEPVGGGFQLLEHLQKMADTRASDLYVFHIGGKTLVESIIHSGLVECIYLTLVHKPYPGDVRIESLPEILRDTINDDFSSFILAGEPEEFDDYTYYKLIAKT
jgi:dihydrofolate reductase